MMSLGGDYGGGDPSSPGSNPSDNGCGCLVLIIIILIITIPLEWWDKGTMLGDFVSPFINLVKDSVWEFLRWLGFGRK